MRLRIDRLRLDGGTQPRGQIDFFVVDEYKEAYLSGAKLPAVTAFHDGAEYWLADGFHRVHAASAAGRESIDADVRQGTREDAVWFSCGANQGHGLRRTNADKRRAVETALRLRAGESDRAIAEHCGVSPATVGTVRAEVSPTVQLEQSRTRTGRDGRTLTTTPEAQSKGGKASAAARKASASETETEPTPPRDFLREAMTPPKSQPEPEPPAPDRQPFGLEYRSGLARIREIMAGFLPVERRAAVAAIAEDQRVEDIA